MKIKIVIMLLLISSVCTAQVNKDTVNLRFPLAPETGVTTFGDKLEDVLVDTLIKEKTADTVLVMITYFDTAKKYLTAVGLRQQNSNIMLFNLGSIAPEMLDTLYSDYDNNLHWAYVYDVLIKPTFAEKSKIGQGNYIWMADINLVHSHYLNLDKKTPISSSWFMVNQIWPENNHLRTTFFGTGNVKLLGN